jgi:hypothetical protein
VTSIHRQEKVVVLAVKPQSRDLLEKALWRRKKDVRLIDEKTIYLVFKDSAQLDDEMVLGQLLEALDPAPPPPPPPPPAPKPVPKKAPPPPPRKGKALFVVKKDTGTLEEKRRPKK